MNGRRLRGEDKGKVLMLFKEREWLTIEDAKMQRWLLHMLRTMNDEEVSGLIPVLPVILTDNQWEQNKVKMVASMIKIKQLLDAYPQTTAEGFTSLEITDLQIKPKE